jgi:exonuclease SbcD
MQTTPFRVLHTADWHLGKMLNEQSREPEQKLFLDWLLKQIVDLEVDVVLVAGDVFDTANPPQSAEALYYNFVADLNRNSSAKLVLIAGNHDSANQLEAPKQALKALRTHIAGALADNVSERVLMLPSDSSPQVALALIPFLREKDLRTGRLGDQQSAVRKEITQGIKRVYDETADYIKLKKLSCPVIATGHLTVAGATSSDSEREIHIGGLGAVDSSTFSEVYSYVALGHLHHPQNPDKANRVRYSGSPIALSFSEVSDKKEIRLLEITDNKIEQKSLPIPVFRKLIQVESDLRSLENKLLAEVGAKSSGSQLKTWVEVILTGHTGQDDANSFVRTITAGKHYEVLKVMLKEQVEYDNSSIGSHGDAELDALLDHPKKVFDYLLEQHPEIEEEQKKRLRLAFVKIMDRIKT